MVVCCRNVLSNSRLYIASLELVLHTLTLEKAMAPHSSTLAWKIPWKEEPGRLQSMGSLGVDMTEQLHFHFSLSCIGEGNGNPPQCSCLEDLRDGEPGGVAQSQTQLTQLSSSSNSYSRLDGVTCFDPKDHSGCDRS